MENNCCKNCKFYLVHYIKNVNGKLITVDCGHCSNGKLNFRTRQKRTKSEISCEFWQPYKEQLLERRANIIKELSMIKARISEIAAVLKDDSEKL